ncbi:hypothetical protein Tco_1010510 [Tanacetum coccineum]
MSTLTFADTHNMVAFLEKPAESDGFHEIIDFLNANQIRYALTVNPIIYTSCIQQFWATAKANTVNGERQLQALIDKKKVIITESSIRSDLHLEDAGGTDCLPTATIFEELARMGYEKPSQKLTFYKAFFSPQWKFLIHTITQCLSAKSTAWNEFSSTMASLIICLATNQKFNLSKYIFDAMVKHLDGGVKFFMYPRFLQVFINQQLGDMSHHKKIYVNPSHTKKIFANMRREGKDFFGRIPLATQPSSSRSQKKQSKRKQRKDTAVTQEEPQQDDSVPTPSNDPPISGEDSMQLSELMIICTNLHKQVLNLEKAKDAQAKEIADHNRSFSFILLHNALVPKPLHGMNLVAQWPLQSYAWPQTRNLISLMFINQQLGDMSHHKKIYVNPSHTKKIFANIKREGKDFSRRVTPLFATMLVQATQAEGVDSGIPTDSQQT